MSVLGKIPASRTKVWEHRTRSPDETFDRLAPIAKAVGITRIAEITDLDRVGIPVFQAVRPLGRSLSVSQGKGASRSAARVSAIMESIEIWHAETETLPVVRASTAEIAEANAIDSALFKRPGASISADDPPFEMTQAMDCESGNQVLVPRDVANLDFTRNASPDWLVRSTDGLAGGNTMGEALSFALAEVIERACQADFELCDSRQRADRRVDPRLAALESPEFASLFERIDKAGLELELFDMTNGVGVTSVRAVLYDIGTSGPVPFPCLGHGAHLAPETALMRAVTEAAQARLTHISGNRDDLDPDFYRDAKLSNMARSMERHMDQAVAHRGLDLTSRSGEAPEADFLKMLDCVLAVDAGPVLYIDLTKDDIGIPVVKVLAPVLRRGLKVRAGCDQRGAE